MLNAEADRPGRTTGEVRPHRCKTGWNRAAEAGHGPQIGGFAAEAAAELFHLPVGPISSYSTVRNGWMNRTNGECQFNARMRDDLLINETLFLSLAHARVEIATWVADYNRERRHSSLGYETLRAYAAEMDRQWSAPLRPTGSATPAIASTATMRNETAWL